MASDLVLCLCNTQTVIQILLLYSLLVGVKAQMQPLHYNCSVINNYTAGSKFQSNVNRLLYRSFFSNSGNSFYTKDSKGEEPDKVHGVFLCMLYVAPNYCQECIDVASEQIQRVCPFSKQAFIWYEDCLVRYSNIPNFASVLDSSGLRIKYNTGNVSEPEQFMGYLRAMFDNLTTQATTVNATMKYAQNSDATSSFQTLYGMVQCLPDLSAVDCVTCLKTAFSAFSRVSQSIAYVPRGVRVLVASCNLRYELYPFTNASVPPSTSQGNKYKGNNTSILPDVPEGTSKNTSNTKLIHIIVSVILALLVVPLAGTIYYLVKRRRRIEKERNERSQEIQLLKMIGETLDENDDFGSEKQGSSREFPLVKVDFIRVATQNFSEENKLGEGGFGPVYKGTLANGMAIAIKRLSRTSDQGLKEFKNEVVLIAKLQHRNLVRLLGCCLEGTEALLIYEFMPNKSLDFFLFDSRENEILEWRQRLHIIKGIAKGILYLHEDSRLRIIHRDLKASNVLLDKDMNPKISDFGMAKMFSGNQRQANTNRVVGTYGYMAPEYAMEGLFSTKSDVFSFGVLLLEIVSGRKNNRYVSEYGQSLLNFAWKLWREGHGLVLMDHCLLQSCVTTEITKCIHIGLLCVQQDPEDRPTMSSVVFMLENDTQTLPQPSQPAFSVGRTAVRSAEPRSNDQFCSLKEVTLSILSPR